MCLGSELTWESDSPPSFRLASMPLAPLPEAEDMDNAPLPGLPLLLPGLPPASPSPPPLEDGGRGNRAPPPRSVGIGDDALRASLYLLELLPGLMKV